MNTVCICRVVRFVALSCITRIGNKRDSWYEIMSNVMPSFKEISSDAYDLLELWCDKVEDTEERAKLILQLTEYVD